MAYRAADDGGLTGERRYRLLVEMLTALITGMMPDLARPRWKPAANGVSTSPNSHPHQRPSAGAELAMPDRAA
jgi:hypothetical protein